MSVWLAMPAADLEGLSALVSGGITANKTPIKSSASSQVRLLEFDYSRGPALNLFSVLKILTTLRSEVNRPQWCT